MRAETQKKDWAVSLWNHGGLLDRNTASHLTRMGMETGSPEPRGTLWQSEQHTSKKPSPRDVDQAALAWLPQEAQPA